MAKVKLAEKYNEIAASGAKFGLVKEEDAHLEDYVTRRALDGLVRHHRRRGEEDPPGSGRAGSAILKKSVRGRFRN